MYVYSIVRIAATLWHGRKSGCHESLARRIKQARRNAQKVRTFHMFCPCHTVAWHQGLYSVRRICASGTQIASMQGGADQTSPERAVSDCLDTWSHLYFVAHAKKAGQRRIIQRLRHFSSACSRSWQRLLENFMAARLSTLEKERLLRIKGQHRLAVRCGQEDAEALFLQSISIFGDCAHSIHMKFVLRCLVRCRYHKLSKYQFSYFIRAGRALRAWRDEYTAKCVKERKARYVTYKRLAQHAANYKEACETAAEMGKFAIVMRIFFRWRDPLRRRGGKLAILLRKTRIRAYIRGWYLLQRKAYIDRTFLACHQGGWSSAFLDLLWWPDSKGPEAATADPC